ncbi:hypothetical protein ACWCPQ_09390 [Nocardia sp. NPDC001965]
MTGALRTAGHEYAGLDTALGKQLDHGRAEGDGSGFHDPDYEVDVPRSAPPYSTVPMKQEYVGEDKKGNQIWGKRRVRYFDEARRQRFLVTVKDGLISLRFPRETTQHHRRRLGKNPPRTDSNG